MPDPDDFLSRIGLPNATARTAVAGVSLVIGVALVFLDRAREVLFAARDAVISGADVLFVVAANVCLFVLAVVAVHPVGKLRLGADDERPEFGTGSWLAMLFSAGLASGILYWATAEPILHAASNPFLGASPAPDAAARLGLRITMFHWGLHGWGFYVLAALAIAIPVHRGGASLRFREILGTAGRGFTTAGWPGASLDLLAIFGTVCGVATSIGLSASSMNATLAGLFGAAGDAPLDVRVQVGIIVAVTLLGIASALSGVARGIRWLSSVNAWVSLGLMGAFLVLGPTGEVVRLIGASFVDYVVSVPALGLFVGESESARRWQADWTLFYWAWWLAWTPFVSLFIVRISRGRTIRELVVGVTLAPTAVTLVWMGLFGGTALLQDRAASGAIARAVETDYALGLVALIEQLASGALATALVAVTCFLLFTWLITSLDSATLVLCELMGTAGTPAAKVFWGVAVATVAVILLGVGGLTALQAASIVIGLPLALVQLAAAGTLLVALFRGRLDAG
ncbi:MAG: BCCT family transporter [Myxococcota bacterium]